MRVTLVTWPCWWKRVIQRKKGERLWKQSIHGAISRQEIKNRRGAGGAICCTGLWLQKGNETQRPVEMHFLKSTSGSDCKWRGVALGFVAAQPVNLMWWSVINARDSDLNFSHGFNNHTLRRTTLDEHVSGNASRNSAVNYLC